MRISDWSADVCSSDLRIDSSVEPSFKHPSNQYLIYLISIRPMDIGGIISPYDGKTDRRERAPSRSPRRALTTVDRKSVVSGKSVAVRVDLGGRRIITKKKNIKLNIITTIKTIN